MMGNRRQTRGFSLIEFLTVFAVIMLMASIALPAMQQTRVDARRITCKNNLKQIALALHNYHQTHAVFPPAWTHHHAKPGATTRYGWTAFLLPFIEQETLYDRLDFRAQDPAADKLHQQKIALYRCPSDTTPDVNPLRGKYGTSNYSGNFGPDAPPRWLPGRLSVDWPGHADTLPNTDGLMSLNSRIRIRDIVDGTSYTILAGERSHTSGAGIWVGVGGNEFENDQVTDCSPGNEINSGFSAFSSRHRDGAYFAFADASVKFLNEKIETGTDANRNLGAYQKLSQRNDGQIVGKYWKPVN